MGYLCSALVALCATTVLGLPVSRQGELITRVEPQGPIPSRESYDVRGLPPQVKQVVVKQLEDEMVKAARAGAAAEAVKIEQKLEDEILATAVRKLSAHRGDKVKQAQDLRELQDLVRRDKRAVEVLSSVLGSSSGGSSGGGGDGEESGDGGGSNILGLLSGVLGSLSGGSSGSGGGDEDGGGGSNVLSLVSSLLGGSSNSGGGGDEDGEGGGGSNILSLIGPLSGSLSGGSSGSGGDGEGGDGGGSNILSLVTGLFGSSSGSSSGSGGDGEEGGSNILSLVSGLSGSSSGSGGGDEGGSSGGSSSGSSGSTGKDPLQGGTYDDLIGHGPMGFFSSALSKLLQFKFTIFRTVFSLITNILTSSSSGSSA